MCSEQIVKPLLFSWHTKYSVRVPISFKEPSLVICYNISLLTFEIKWALFMQIMSVNDHARIEF